MSSPIDIPWQGAAQLVAVFGRMADGAGESVRVFVMSVLAIRLLRFEN